MCDSSKESGLKGEALSAGPPLLARSGRWLGPSRPSHGARSRALVGLPARPAAVPLCRGPVPALPRSRG